MSLLRFLPYTPAILLITTGLVAGASPRPAAGPELSVTRTVLTHGVEGREPKDSVGTFRASDGRVVAFVELENPRRIDTSITVVFVPPSGPTAEIPLHVGETSRYRTWASTRQAHEIGTWTVLVRDSGGHVLARHPFKVER
jgi:hypothetical protein